VADLRYELKRRFVQNCTLDFRACATQLLQNGYLCGVCPRSGTAAARATGPLSPYMTLHRRTLAAGHHSARDALSPLRASAATSGLEIVTQRLF